MWANSIPNPIPNIVASVSWLPSWKVEYACAATLKKNTKRNLQISEEYPRLPLQKYQLHSLQVQNAVLVLL